MAEGALTAELILGTTEDVLRRYGPAKATVVDVARALGVSHGSVYRHFPTKAALREAVARRWLERWHEGLADVAHTDAPAEQRLRDWLSTLFEIKRQKVREDPELFDTFATLMRENLAVVDDHVTELENDLEKIIADGIEAGDFAPRDSRVAARAVFDATNRFHDPIYAADWKAPTIDVAFSAVVSLVVSGLSVPD